MYNSDSESNTSIYTNKSSNSKTVEPEESMLGYVYNWFYSWFY